MTRLLPILGLIIATVAISVHSVVIRVENLPEKCDYSKCTAPDPTRINVHLVPHTHDDVGWLKTVDQYFYGLRSNIQKAGVQYIIDSVIEELVRNKDRRFIYVETAFFWKWWKEQDQETRDIVHELVKTGQLEFINGGWSMSDEATVQYNSFIDQTTWGLRRLNDTFGKCGVPKVTWQIDPFGHSKELASLFAQMNYDAVFFAREDWQELHFRRQNKTLEHVWQGSEDLGTAGDLFTGMMDFGYGPPQGFNWDLVGGGDEPVIDNKDSEEYNVPHMIEKLVNLAKRYQKSYATKNVMFPMGTDFQYQDAHVYFKNMDKLISHVNAGSKEVKIFYSTPSCYAKALHDSVGHASWTGKADDYFPYASDPHAYWTGYFVSRAALKRFERVGNNVLQACKQVDVLAGNGDALEREITSLREIMGVMQHHDAVAGTEKQHVADDYARNLHAGIEACRDVLQRSYHKLQAKATANLPTIQKQVFCDYLNASSCSATEAGRNFALNVYNPLGAPLVNKVLRLPVATSGGKFYEVLSPEGKPVPSELVAIPEAVRNLPERKHSTATEELVFQASAPALGLATYFVQVSSTRSANSAAEVKGVKISAETKLKAANFEVVFDASGALSKVVLKSGQSVPLSSNFRFYKGAADEKVRASGAYVFRPLTQETFSAGKLLESNLFTKEGGVHEVHQKYDSYVEQVVRVSPTSDQLEFEYIVGPIPVGDHVGKEVVLQYSADLKNGGVFYTDANGRQMVKRQWNARRHLKLNVTEPISGNYYPINSRIMLKDEAKKLVMTVLTDRSQGGTSPQDGVLELMVHRRLLHDDHFGVGEPLNEPGVDGKGLIIRGKHVLQLSTLEEAGKSHREAGREMFLEPILSFVPDVAPYDVFSKSYHTEVSGLTKALPANVHLLTLEQWSGGRLLLRLEHFFQKGEHAELSKPVTLSLKGLFKHFEITAAQELTLAANQDVSALKNRLKFKYTADGPVTEPAETKAFNAQTMEVTLNPMQIRTFAVTVKRN